MSHIIPQAEATEVAQVGGKAAALAHLATHGFAPPTFFVIRAEAFEGDVPSPACPTRSPP